MSNDSHDNNETDAVMLARHQQMVLARQNALPKPASRKSISYMQALSDQHDYDKQYNEMPQQWQDIFVAARADTSTEDPSTQFAQADVSKFIDMLKQCPPRQQQDSFTGLKGNHPMADQQELEDGIYQKPSGVIYRVYFNLAHTHLLAKKLIIVNPGDRETGIKATVKWQYTGAATRFVQPDEKMPYDEAKAFGELYGMCIYGHPLNDPVSIHLGIGPVCGERQFGGDFKFMVDQAKLEVKGKQAGKPSQEEQAMTPDAIKARLAELNKELAE